jgi:hypothetical protein
MFDAFRQTLRMASTHLLAYPCLELCEGWRTGMELNTARPQKPYGVNRS